MDCDVWDEITPPPTSCFLSWCSSQQQKVFYKLSHLPRTGKQRPHFFFSQPLLLSMHQISVFWLYCVKMFDCTSWCLGCWLEFHLKIIKWIWGWIRTEFPTVSEVNTSKHTSAILCYIITWHGILNIDNDKTPKSHQLWKTLKTFCFLQNQILSQDLTMWVKTITPISLVNTSAFVLNKW